MNTNDHIRPWQIAQMNDQRLLTIATYAKSKGLVKKIKNREDLINIFSLFKRWVKDGEFSSIEELEKFVYQDFGVMPIKITDYIQNSQHIIDDVVNAPAYAKNPKNPKKGKREKKV